MKKTKLILATVMLALLFSGCGGMGPGEDNPKSDVHKKIPTPEELTIEPPDPTDTNPENAFNDILNNPDWGIRNKDAISYDSGTGIYTFDARYQTCCIKRKIILSEKKRISFMIKPYIYEKYDGCIQFLIDDNIIAEYKGENLDFESAQFELDAGTHTIEWRRYDEIEEYTVFGNTGIQPNVQLCGLEFKTPLQAITSISQDFDDSLNPEMWTGAGLSSKILDNDPVFAKQEQYGNALIDTHGKVYQLACAIGEGKNIITGDSSLTIQKIQISTESTLSFDYKCDLLNWTDENGTYHRNYLKVYLDNNQSPVFDASGNGQMWQKASIKLLPGTHTVKFVCGTDDGWYAGGLTNATYLDNFTLVPDTIDSVDIYPKGLQETYVNGDSIQFSAKALRSDVSVIDGKSVTWTCTGGSIDSNGLFTPGSTEGTFTVTATIDGQTASNQNVKVHGANYLTDPVTIGSNTFTGKITDGAGIRYNTNNITLYDPTPAYRSFTTNGFFVIKGSAPNTKGVSVFIARNEPENKTYYTDDEGNIQTDYKYQACYYIPAGDFEQRVWLRFGDGDYIVYINEVTETNSCEDYNGYEGAVLGWWTSGEEGTWLYYNVTNKTGLNLSAEDYAALTPSAWCQCDDFLVSNPFNAIMAELPNATIGQKLQALYDWEIHNFHYDFVSFTDNQSTNKRKKQDAVHAVKYGMAVCEGYADLYTAFARLAGLKSIYQTSEDFNHAWTEVYYNDAWKMIDATWDDPSEVNSTNKFPTSEYYYYFLIDPDDASHIKKGKNKSDRQPDISRTISTIQTKYPSSVN